MQVVTCVFKKMEKFGLFVSGIVNYVLLLIVYIFGVTLTWCLVKLTKKELLDTSTNKKTFWKTVPSNDDSLERARRMY